MKQMGGAHVRPDAGGSGQLLVFPVATRRTRSPRRCVPVRTAQVGTIDVGNALKYSASIVPYTQVDLAFKSNGYVESVLQVPSASGGRRNVDQGDWVKKGTVLAVVSRQDYLDKLQQANAQLSRAQAEYVKAKLSFDRTSALYSSQSATKPELDSAQAQLDSTTASVSAAKAQVSEAQVALDYCSLAAPFDGWIVKRSVDVGSLVGPATNGFSIADTQTVKAVFGVPDIYISRRQNWTTIGHHDRCAPGRIRGQGHDHFSCCRSQEPRVFRGSLDSEPNNFLKSGMIATLSIPGQATGAGPNRDSDWLGGTRSAAPGWICGHGRGGPGRRRDGAGALRSNWGTPTET